MRARQHRVVFYLNDKELENLNRKAVKAKLPREAYLRKAISGTVLIEAPPIEYYELLREVKKSGSQIDRLLKLAESGAVPEAAEIRKALDCNTAAELLLWDAFAPEK